MHFWGVQIDTVSSILLSVGLGLAIDYSVHIAHAFNTSVGKSNDERVKKTIVEMGPAVFNGGFSTFLAFAVFVFAESFAFKVFLKIFFLISVFGLYHGLVFLPVILSLVDPPALTSKCVGSYDLKNELTTQENNDKEKSRESRKSI
jgi:predicted RND superfamily exporter protein